MRISENIDSNKTCGTTTTTTTTTKLTLYECMSACVGIKVSFPLQTHVERFHAAGRQQQHLVEGTST